MTINGMREIPMEVSSSLLSKLKDSNSEVRLKIVASLTEAGTRPSHGEGLPEEVIRLKATIIEIDG